jgi:hypothetical protein
MYSSVSAERRNVVFARVPSHFKRSLPHIVSLGLEPGRSDAVVQGLDAFSYNKEVSEHYLSRNLPVISYSFRINTPCKSVDIESHNVTHLVARGSVSKQ